MSFIPHTIATVVLALFIPSTTASDVHTSDPLPIAPVQIEAPATEYEEEVKPILSDVPVVKTEACNCYNILKKNFDFDLSMDQLMASAKPELGNVALMMYPATQEWPNGIPHVAVVRKVLPDGSMEIEEYNYHSCTHSFRNIPQNYSRLIGFTNLQPLSPSPPL